MRLQFILSEIGLGLRRNLSMTISVILVTFVSLMFVGSAALIQQQIAQMKDDWYGKVEVSVFLCPRGSELPTCASGEVTPDQMWEHRLSARTPVAGLYLCGAATHPAGSVIALNGRNAAMAVLEDQGGKL